MIQKHMKYLLEKLTSQGSKAARNLNLISITLGRRWILYVLMDQEVLLISKIEM